VWGHGKVKVVNVANWICLTADPSLRPGASLRACGGALHKQRFAMRSLYGGNDNVSFGHVPSVPDLGQGNNLVFNQIASP